jgi:hypothetical protein
MSKTQQTAGPLGKISEGDEGLGTITPEMVAARARELAVADGRTEANEKDLVAARAELVPTSLEPLPPEVDSPEVEQITEWDTPPSGSGKAAPQVLPEDEANIAEELVEEGIDEADHATRVEAGREEAKEEGEG